MNDGGIVMQLQYEDNLLESAVFHCSSGRHGVEFAGAPPMQIRRFHREREKLYSILDPDDRNTAFFRLHLEWFREWGMEQSLLDTLDEFPLLGRELATLVFRSARNKTEECAELYVNDAGTRNASVALRANRFCHRTELTAFLRHELMHLHDMLDPAFGYLPGHATEGGNAARQRTARERYRVLWDITIDGRLNASNRSPMADRKHHWSEFQRGYSFWKAETQEKVFRSLWEEGSVVRHAQLWEIASDPRGLRHTDGPLPGAPCPLCGFPTFNWAPQNALDRRCVMDVIAAEFPDWTAEQGICGRCLEVFESSARSERAVA